MVVSAHDDYIFTGGKDGDIIKWSLITGKKLLEFPGMRMTPEKRPEDTRVTGHMGHVLAVALSTDGKFLASGGRDDLVFVWDLSTSVLVRTFRGHKV